jgi:hypothetical protein
MADRRKRRKQITVYKTLHRKFKIEQHHPHFNASVRGVTSSYFTSGIFLFENPDQIHLLSKRPHIIIKVNNNRNMDSTIAGSVDARIFVTTR